MHVYFLNYGNFTNTGSLHIFNLANEIIRQGGRSTVLVQRNPELADRFGTPLFQARTFKQFFWRALPFGQTRKNGDAILHAWTPREPVRVPTKMFARMLAAPYVVHLEDNEPYIYQRYSAWQQARGFAPPKKLIAPSRWREFLARADGITCITESLREFVPDTVPSRVFWPACEPEFFELPVLADPATRAALGIAAGDFVLFYPGNIHPANAGDVSALYDAVKLAIQRKIPLRLARAGYDDVGLTASLGSPDWLIDLGDRPARDMPRLMKIADVAVQPGGPDKFNSYRFPCKLPMFLASGRPVVLPACNIGAHLQDGRDCITTQTGTAEEIAEILTYLYENPDVRSRIGDAGRAFARSHLQWDKAATTIMDFYQSILAKKPRVNRA